MKRSVGSAAGTVVKISHGVYEDGNDIIKFFAKDGLFFVKYNNENAIEITSEIAVTMQNEYERQSYSAHLHGEAVTAPTSLDVLHDEGVEMPDFTNNPEAVYLKSEQTGDIHKVLAMLSDNERELFRLLFVEELTEREYADYAKCSASTAHARKEKLLKNIKELLKNYKLF